MKPSPPRPAAARYTNPVFAESFPDPFVFIYDGRYYAIATGRALDEGDGPTIFPMLTSDDFVEWRPSEPAMIAPNSSLGTDFWAPEIAYRDGRFYLYYSVGQEDKGHQLRVAVSEHPGGPYSDSGEPVLDPTSCAFAIDAHPFRDDNGKWFLFYARDFFDTDRPGTSIVVASLDEPLRISTEFSVVARAGHDWQRYQSGRVMHGSTYDWHTLEGPSLVIHEGRYYCLYSGGNWQNASYGLDYVVADCVTGPYRDDNTGEPRLLKTVPGKVLGPGHNSVVMGPDGRTSFIAYHAWDIDLTARRLCLDRLDWSISGPSCLGPTSDPQEVVVRI